MLMKHTGRADASDGKNVGEEANVLYNRLTI